MKSFSIELKLFNIVSLRGQVILYKLISPRINIFFAFLPVKRFYRLNNALVVFVTKSSYSIYDAEYEFNFIYGDFDRNNFRPSTHTYPLNCGVDVRSCRNQNSPAISTIFGGVVGITVMRKLGPVTPI